MDFLNYSIHSTSFWQHSQHASCFLKSSNPGFMHLMLFVVWFGSWLEDWHKRWFLRHVLTSVEMHTVLSEGQANWLCKTNTEGGKVHLCSFLHFKTQNAFPPGVPDFLPFISGQWMSAKLNSPHQTRRNASTLPFRFGSKVWKSLQECGWSQSPEGRGTGTDQLQPQQRKRFVQLSLRDLSFSSPRKKYKINWLLSYTLMRKHSCDFPCLCLDLSAWI